MPARRIKIRLPNLGIDGILANQICFRPLSAFVNFCQGHFFVGWWGQECYLSKCNCS